MSFLGLLIFMYPLLGLANKQTMQNYICPLNDPPRHIRPKQDPFGYGYYGAPRDRGSEKGVHAGIDISGTEGESVLAVHDGVVIVSADWTYRKPGRPDGGPGNAIILCHTHDFMGEKSGNGHFSVYYHLKERFVEAGDEISAGAVIGSVGYTGNAMAFKEKGYEPHLHFELSNPGIGCENITKVVKEGKKTH